MILLRSLADFPDSLRGGAVAIGNFDGVHLGHARLVQRLRAMADRVAGAAIVFTFDPPPARILHPEAAPEPLVWIERKTELLAALGADAVLIYPTDLALLGLDARDFFDRIVQGRLAAKAMVEGPNFFFGHDRSGNVEVLRQLCAACDMPFEVPEPVRVEDQIVSSSRIRLLVAKGQVAEAATMLGRPYRIRGVAVPGAQRGSRLGFPTANLAEIDTLLPAEGIYAGRAMARGAWHPAAVSLGPNPTFDEGRLKVEAHLVGLQGELYGERIEVDFLARLRDIRRFSTVGELLAQLARDVARTIEIAA
ncbi:MAG: riboflavin biosynthesis protein RibF [Thermoguttaceae bacterium]